MLLREVGLVRPHADQPSALDVVPLFETIDDLGRAAGRARRTAHLAVVPAHRRRPRQLAGGDDRLLRLEQGRRLSHVELGAVPGPAAAGRRRRLARRAAAPVPRSRRLRRARRRAGLRGDPRPAAGFGSWSDPHHRAGRDGGGEVRPAGLGPAQPGDAAGGDDRGVGRHRRRPRRRRRTLRRGRWTSCPRPPTRRYRSLVFGEGDFAGFFAADHADQRDRHAEHRQPSGVTDRISTDRGSAGHPLGLRLDPVPGDAAGLVRVRLGVRTPRRRRPARRDVRPLAVLPHR